MIKLVVFDWNGTLLADNQAVLEATNHVLKASGRPRVTAAKYRESYDIPVVKIYEALGIPKQELLRNSIEHARVFHEFYEPRAVRCRTRSGSRRILDRLKSRKIAAVLLSNHTTEGVYAQLARLKLEGYFDEILTNEEAHTVHTIGKRQRLIDYLKRSHHQAKEALIIGDTHEEINIGRELGLKTVAFSGGHVSTRRLRMAKPDYLIHNLTQLLPIIKKAI